MIWAFFAVVALIAGVLCYLGAKSWPIWHVVVVFFLVVSLAGLMVLASLALKTHSAWRSEHAKLAKQVLTTEQTLTKLRDSNSLLSADEALTNLPGVTEALSQTVLDRGRVWRNVSPVEFQAGRITLDLANWGDRRCARVGLGGDEELEPEPIAEPAEGEGDAAAAPAAAATATHQLSVSTIVYAFRETPITNLDDAKRKALFGEESYLVANDTNGVCKIPTVYVGDFRIAEVNNNTVVIAPLSPLDEFQQQALADSQGATWTLYELMPLDSHQAFTSIVAATTDSGDVSDENGAGENGGEQNGATAMAARRAAIAALIPQTAITSLSQADYDKLIDSYARDQMPAAPGDPPTLTLTQVRFLQEHSIDVDLEDAESGAEASYDPSGRAQLPHLKHGSAVTFSKDDEQYFDSETAERLIRDGIAERTDKPKLYSRPLVDYVLFFHENEMELDRLAGKITTLTNDSRDVVAAAEKARAQIAYRNEEKAKLASDHVNYERETSVLNELLTKLQAQRKAQKSEIAFLYQSNRDLESQLRGVFRFGASAAGSRR